jgi:hypothetical protein
MRTVAPQPADIGSAVKPGDRVRVTTRDGQVLKFEVTRFTESSLVGESSEGKSSDVPLAEITQLDLVEFSPGKSIGLVAGVLAGLLLIGAIMFMIQGPDIDFRR